MLLVLLLLVLMLGVLKMFRHTVQLKAIPMAGAAVKDMLCLLLGRLAKHAVWVVGRRLRPGRSSRRWGIGIES